MFKVKKIFFLGLVILFLSCEKEGELTKTTSKSIESNSILKYSGIFTPTSGINVQGKANVYFKNTLQQLQLENISISDGPDLKVYLSKTNTPSDFVNLGNFKGNGTSVYEIPTVVNVSQYQYVLIHCQQYNHLFAIAQLTAK